MNEIKTTLDPLIWEICQIFGYLFGKKEECYSPAFKKEGKCFTNAYNKTVWFIPNDHSFTYGGDDKLEKRLTK